MNEPRVVTVHKTIMTAGKGEICGEDCQFMDRWGQSARCKLFHKKQEEKENSDPIRLQECKEAEVT